MLPPDLLQYLNEQIPCRQAQILQLASLLNPSLPSPPTIVIHGTIATGKTLTVSSVVSALDLLHTVVKVRECITARHLLERTVLGVKAAIESKIAQSFDGIDGRCENLSSLAVILDRMLGNESLDEQKFVLILDGIDKLRDVSGLQILTPGLARLGEIIPNLTVVLVTTTPLYRSLHKPHLPHIHFTPYDRASVLKILEQSPLPIFPLDEISQLGDDGQRPHDETDDLWLWKRYTGLVWDSFGKTAARDVVSMRNLCRKLWLPFVSHIRDGSYGARDFSRLVVRTRDLFREESVLVDGLLPSNATAAPKEGNEIKRKLGQASHDLSYYTKHLLLAAYLASYNPSRTDQTVFSRLHERKKKKKIVARKNATTKKKDGVITAMTSKHRKISRLLLGPQPFGLDRMLAIFHALLPEKAPAGNADILCQIATLANLRMLVKAASTSSADIVGGLDNNAKWRVNMGWEYVVQLGKRVGVDMVDYIVE